MKLYLASYYQPQYHGTGKKIAISDRKPDDFKVDGAFRQFIPDRVVLDHYYDLRDEDPEKAKDFFVSCFKTQLEEFFLEVESEAEKEKVSIKELLPFEDGDTLLSMERFEYTSYRPLVADFLRKAGYDLTLH